MGYLTVPALYAEGSTSTTAFPGKETGKGVLEWRVARCNIIACERDILQWDEITRESQQSPRIVAYRNTSPAQERLHPRSVNCSKHLFKPQRKFGTILDDTPEQMPQEVFGGHHENLARKIPSTGNGGHVRRSG
jgi:hypothetical protein